MTLRWGPTGLMLGDALTIDKAEAADLLRACVRVSAQQLADDSSTSVRPGPLRKLMLKFEVTGDERLTRRGTDSLLSDSGRGSHASGLHSQDRVLQPSVEARESKGDAAARGEHGKHPDHDGCISGGQNSAHAGGPGERLRKMDARRTPHGHEESVFASHQTLPRTADDLPKHAQSSSGFPRVQ